MEDNKGLERQFTVVFRAPAALLIPAGQNIRVNTSFSKDRPTITLTTRFLDKGFESQLPGNMWITTRGYADTLENAISSMSGPADSILTLLAFGSNAAIDHMDPELAFESTPGVPIREFFQSMIPEEPLVLHSGRPIPDNETIYAFIRALESFNTSPTGRERILRAMAQYRFALRHWRLGRETLATAHLFMGMEALVQVVLEHRLASNNITKKELALQFGIASNVSSSNQLGNAVDAAIRKMVLFQGDLECHKNAKKASDGFEHGFLPFGKIREHAQKARDRTAHYLRVAILDLLNLELEHRQTLLAPPFDKPLGNFPWVKYVKGELIGDENEIAGQGTEPPRLEWSTTIKSATINELGEYKISVEEKLTPRIGEGVSFRLKSREVWEP